MFHNEVSKKLPREIQTIALRKLVQLHAAGSLLSLRVPPGNRLEALTGSRVGEHSIRIIDQCRICFTRQDADPERQAPAGARDVEIAGYH